MVTIQVTSGNQVQGLRLLDPMKDKLFGDRSDGAIVNDTVEFFREYMSIIIDARDDTGYVQSYADVIDATEIID